jgi:hypothetical protein
MYTKTIVQKYVEHHRRHLHLTITHRKDIPIPYDSIQVQINRMHYFRENRYLFSMKQPT